MDIVKAKQMKNMTGTSNIKAVMQPEIPSNNKIPNMIFSFDICFFSLLSSTISVSFLVKNYVLYCFKSSI